MFPEVESGGINPVDSSSVLSLYGHRGSGLPSGLEERNG